MKPGGVGDDFPNIVLRVEPAVFPLCVPRPARIGIKAPFDLVAPGPDVCELGIAFDFKAPGLRVVEVPVEDVELVFGHDVQKMQDFGLGEKMPGDVDHQMPPRKSRPVPDPHAGQRLVLLPKLLERHLAIETPSRRIGSQANGLRQNQ